MLKVLLTGASGMVGTRVLELLKQDFSWLSPSSQELDIVNAAKTKRYIQTHDFDIFIHLAAFTNVDQAEIERTLCRQLNVEGTANVFNAVKTKNKPFIFVSTDFVFDGKQLEYNENSIPNPICYYGQTKYEAEQLIKDQGMIVRLSYPYGLSSAPKKDFVTNILGLLKKNQPIRGIVDSIFTPTYLDDLANNLKYLIHNFKPQIYHLVGPESLSPYSAFVKIAEIFKQDKTLVKPITYQEYFKNKSLRPKNGKITSLYQFYKPHSFTQGLTLVKELSS